MIPYLEAQLTNSLSFEAQRSVVREYLQMRILQSLQRAGAMIPLAFLGGTALRLLYHTQRYSEDLDFALERNQDQYDFQGYLAAIQRDMSADAYNLDIKYSDQRIVHSALIRFRGLLHQLHITPHEDEVISIKLEIDTNPPSGATLNTTIVRHHVDVNLQHHDKASLLAGKLHAILQRDYVKGRDWYDLYWYLRQAQWPLPNLAMLNQALIQSAWDKGLIDENNWRQHVSNRLAGLNWRMVLDDTQRFIMDQDTLSEFRAETLQRLLATA